VIVDRGQIDLGARRDLPQRHRFVAELDEQGLGGIEDAGFRVAGGPARVADCHVAPPLPVARHANKRFKFLIETGVLPRIRDSAVEREEVSVDGLL
jgi:hypothetical protein